METKLSKIVIHGLAGASLFLLVEAVFVTNQLSTSDHQWSHLATDGDFRTCSVTGFDIGPWWKADLGSEKWVSGVNITGSLDAFQVRVGQHSAPHGHQGGFQANNLCVFSMGLTAPDEQSFPCIRERLGRYVSIHVVDPASVKQLRLCDVNIEYR